MKTRTRPHPAGHEPKTPPLCPRVSFARHVFGRKARLAMVKSFPRLRRHISHILALREEGVAAAVEPLYWAGALTVSERVSAFVVPRFERVCVCVFVLSFPLLCATFRETFHFYGTKRVHGRPSAHLCSGFGGCRSVRGTGCLGAPFGTIVPFGKTPDLYRSSFAFDFGSTTVGHVKTCP